MSLPKKLLKFLEEKKVKYEVIEHRTVYTAWDCAQTLKVKPAMVVKTLVVKLQGKDPALVLIAADRNLDQKKFMKVAHNWLRNPKSTAPNFNLQAKVVSKLSFANEKWMKEKIGGKVGATLPFGSLMKFPTFMDKALVKQKELILSSGDYQLSLKMKAKDFTALEPVVTGAFSILKKSKIKSQKSK